MITFVDAEQGALSLLAVGVARSLGLHARAATSSPRAGAPSEIAQVLDEVGMRLPEDGAALLSAINTAEDNVIFLGKEPPSSLAHRPAWGLALYPGEGDIERLSTARIVRDQIERRLEKA